MYQSTEDRTGVIIDNGSSSIKAGFTGDAAPRSYFPSVIGSSKHAGIMIATGSKGSYAGEEAQSKRGTLDMKNVIQGGLVSNWDDIEKLWHYTFFEALQVPPEANPVLMTDSPDNSKPNREKMVDVLFETFNTPATYISTQAVLALYASGRTTGCVLDYGHGSAHTVPIFEGYALPHNIHKECVVGSDITASLHDLLLKKGYELTTLAEKEVVVELKERMTYLALDYERELYASKNDVNIKDVKFDLPDGSKLYIGSERFECTEALFDPSKLGKDGSGIVADTITGCEFDIRKTLFENIILCGGNTMFPNMEERLSQEISCCSPPNSIINVVAPPERKYSVWIGGSILTSLATFSSMWITKEEFEEYGATLVHKKCF